MYFRCIDEQHRLMELPSISSVTNLQDRQQVVKQMITAGKGSLTMSTVKFIQGLPNNHPLHWVYHVPKGLGSGNTPSVRVHQLFSLERSEQYCP